MENDLFHYTGIAFRTFQCYTFQQIYRLAVPSRARAGGKRRLLYVQNVGKIDEK